MSFFGSRTFGLPQGYGNASPSPQAYQASPEGYAEDGYGDQYYEGEEEGELLSKSSPTPNF